MENMVRYKYGDICGRPPVINSEGCLSGTSSFNEVRLIHSDKSHLHEGDNDPWLYFFVQTCKICWIL